MTRVPPVLRGTRRRAAVASAAALAVAASVVPSLATGGVGTADAAAAAPAASSPSSPSSGGVTAESFANPPRRVRPMYRWWMPLAYTEDNVLRQELRDIAAAGGGGVEVSPFVVPGAGNQSTAFTAEYGWGTPAWAHKMEVITEEAAELGLVVDQNLGPQYPATVPTLNSFNQPEAEQQLVFGREFVAAGGTRTGALPAPTTAVPSVSTKLCGPAVPGDEVLRVEKVGGMAAGDTVTVGSGATAEKVVVSGLGDRTAACADMSVSALAKAHDMGETVVNVARTTRIKTLVAQCVSDCGPDSTGPVQLVPDSVVDVTSSVVGGKLDHAFATGNGNPWVVIDLVQTASGLIAQSGGYTETHPNYVVDHWSRGGARIQGDFWDDNILTKAVQRNLDKVGGGAVFEDSLELGETQKWTWGLLKDFTQLRGYDPTLLLPALAGTGIQGDGTPAFELAGVGAKVREDYRETLSDLYTERYVATMQRWAAGHGLTFRAQAYGTPVHSGVAAAATGIPEGESLNFGAGNNQLGAEQNYRVVAGGAHVGGRNVVSVECCAIFQGGYRSSLAGASVPGQFGQGGDGSAVGGRYSQGLLDSIYKAYAGGVNQLVWHGYAYRDAPRGVGSSGRDGGSWPGYHPWDIFGVISVNDEFGPRQASWEDYEDVNDALARTQLVLQEGRATVDLGVYYAEYGLLGQSVGHQGPVQHMLGNDSATSKAGYTYDYVAPNFLEGIDVEADGGLFGDTSDQKALVLNNQTTMAVEDAERLLELARNGLKLFVVGDAPASTPGAAPGAEALHPVVADLLAEPTVTEVATEDLLPAALAAAGVRPAVAPTEPTSALGFVRRRAGDVTYDFVYNRSGDAVEQEITLTGSGAPYELDTWTGQIEPIADYTTTADGVTLTVDVGAHDAIILALADKAAAPAQRLAVHAVDSTGEIVTTGRQGAQALALRVSEDGTYTSTFSNGVKRTTTVAGVAPAQDLGTWTLNAQTWTPGENAYTTTRTDQPEVAVTAGENGRLPSWREITSPVDLSQASGIGTYRTTVTLPETWSSADGAHLDLGDVLDSATVTVNGTAVAVNQADRSRVDLGDTLVAGDNEIEVRVATTMFNAVRKSGDSNYQTPAWQDTGLMGPVTLTPYRDTVLNTAVDPTGPTDPDPAVVATTTKLKVSPHTLRRDRRAAVVVRVKPRAGLTGTVRIVVDGVVVRTATVSNGRATVKLPKLKVGKHRVRAVYAGNDRFSTSASKVVKIKVLRKRS